MVVGEPGGSSPRCDDKLDCAWRAVLESGGPPLLALTYLLGLRRSAARSNPLPNNDTDGELHGMDGELAMTGESDERIGVRVLVVSAWSAADRGRSIDTALRGVDERL